MAAKRPVGAPRVREWFGSAEGQTFLAEFAEKKKLDPATLTIGHRGKLSEHVIAAFHAANKREVYTVGHKPAVKITGKRENAGGQKRTVTVSATLGEIRDWAKSPEGVAAGVKVGSRGRVSEAVKLAFVARPVTPATDGGSTATA